MSKTQLLDLISLCMIYFILSSSSFSYNDLIERLERPELYHYELIKKKSRVKSVIFIIIYISLFCITYMEGGEFMVLEFIFLTLLLITVIVRLYSVSVLNYMKENRIYDDKKRKRIKITFISSDVLLFLLVILYLFIKGFSSGIF